MKQLTLFAFSIFILSFVNAQSNKYPIISFNDTDTIHLIGKADFGRDVWFLSYKNNDTIWDESCMSFVDDMFTIIDEKGNKVAYQCIEDKNLTVLDSAKTIKVLFDLAKYQLLELQKQIKQ